MSRTAWTLLTVMALSLPAGCAGPDADLPPASGRFDYQLGGAYEPDGGLDVVVRDASAGPLAGAYSVCYVNGFQT